MSRLTKNISKMLACALLLALIFPLVNMGSDSLATNSGQVKVEDHQFILEEMDPSGKVENVRVLDWLALKGDGTVDVERTTGLNKPPKIQNMKGFAAPEVKGDTIFWKGLKATGTVNVSNVISQNTLKGEDLTKSAMTEKVPLEVRYSYYLDGKKMELKDIAGKSGKFRLECYMKNLSKKKTLVTYTDSPTGERKTEVVETYLPLVISPMDWYFDNEVFSNLKADPYGIVSYIPTDFQVSWSIPLFPPASEEDLTIWVEADVKNFSMKPLSLTCAFIFPKTNQTDPLPQFQAGLAELYGGVVLLGAGLGEAVAGLGASGISNTLIDGIGQITGGLSLMADPAAGLPYAAYNVNSLMVPGVQQMVAGLGSAETPDTLLFGANAIFNGLSQVSGGVGTAETPDTLLYGTNLITGGLNQMTAGIGSPTTPDTLLYGMDQMTAGVNELKAGIGTGPTDPDTLYYLVDQTRISTSPTGEGGPNTSMYVALNNNIYLPLQSGGLVHTLRADQSARLNTILGFKQHVDPAQSGAFQTEVEACINDAVLMNGDLNDFSHLGYFSLTLYVLLGEIQSSYDQVVRIDPNNPGALQGVSLMAAGIGDAGTPDTLLYGLDQVTGGLNLMQAGIGSPTTPDTLLYGMDQITGGLNQMQGGLGSPTTPDTLLYGMDQMTGGLLQIQGGLGSATTPDTLLYGANAIYGGLSQVKGGATTGSMANPGLLEGLELLGEGLNEAVAGVGSTGTANTLLWGTDQINNGLEQLKAGLTRAVTEGTDVMKQGIGEALKELDLTFGELKAIEERGDKFDTFLGRVQNKGSTSDMRFLLQTAPVQNPNQNNGWLIALVLSLVGAAGLVVLGIFAFKRYA